MHDTKVVLFLKVVEKTNIYAVYFNLHKKYLAIKNADNSLPHQIFMQNFGRFLLYKCEEKTLKKLHPCLGPLRVIGKDKMFNIDYETLQKKWSWMIY